MRAKRGGGTCTELRLSGGENSHVAAEYSVWGADVHRSRTQIISNEDKEIGGPTDCERGIR